MASKFYRCPESNLGIQVFRHHYPISFPPHCHSELAIVICTEGILESTQSGNKELLHAGQVLFTNTGIPHSSRYCPDGRPTGGVTVELDSNTLRRLGYNGASVYLFAKFLGTMCLPEVTRLARIIQDESLENEQDSPLLIAALARQIVVLVLRMWPRTLIHRHEFKETAQLPRNELVRSIEFMRVTPARDFAVDNLAKYLHRSTATFSRLFKHSAGESPYSFYLNTVLERAANRLATTEDPVKVIALGLGFDSISHFSNAFRIKWDMTPTDYRRKVSRIRQPHISLL